MRFVQGARVLGYASLFAAVAAVVAAVPKPAERTFEFTYTTQVEGIPDGAKSVAIWIPYPVSDAHQKIRNVKVSSPLPERIDKDPLYGNSILYLAGPVPAGRKIDVTVSFDATRLEYVHRGPGDGTPSVETPAHLARWLQADKLVPIDGRIRSLAEEVTQGKASDLEKAHAIFEYVVSTMKYDKSGSGWGHGDIMWACDAKRGNCTDFHALFTGLCRAVGIPAKFAIGFPLPEKHGEGEIPGYHCWAAFYLNGYGWVPVDASEAWKNPDRREYFFGAHDANRIQLSIGRDVELNPPQSGQPVNYFVYPYVEVDGKPFDGVKKKFWFKDLDASNRASLVGAALQAGG